MKTIPQIIIWVCLITTSCGLASKYKSTQHSVYAKTLTQSDKEKINQSGEITKDIELGDGANKNLLKGTLRIIRTERSDFFIFVEIGQWIEHGQYRESGQTHNVEVRDTIVYDNNGNIVSRKVYDTQDGKLRMTNEWSSEIIKDSFIQHIQVYDKGILRAEYSKKVVDYLVPGSDLQKKKVPVGIDKGYYPSGELGYIRTYDQDGKLISEEIGCVN